jgi:hypothetical protein
LSNGFQQLYNLEYLQKLTGRLSGALLQLTDQMPLDVEQFNPDTFDDGVLGE